METFQSFRVVVMVNDKSVGEFLVDTMRCWGLCGEYFTQPVAAFEHLSGNKCDIILLDVYLSDVCCHQLIPKFGSDAKIIIMAGSHDRDTAIPALKFGAFDLLEKPFQNELLYHSICRALTVLENERKAKRLMDELQDSHSELLAQQQRLKNLRTRILETNRAISIFSKNIDREREESEKRIALKLRNMIMPEVMRLRNDPALHKHEALLDILTMQIEDLTAGFAVDSRVIISLSSAEMRVASLIKNGVRTEEIARKLHVSENTVRTHRKNIRKKLRLNNTQCSLRNFLASGIQEPSNGSPQGLSDGSGLCIVEQRAPI
jgi:FixJ family two-component response regulator